MTPISEIHLSFDHPFIVKMLSYEDDRETKKRYIFMEVSASGIERRLR